MEKVAPAKKKAKKARILASRGVLATSDRSMRLAIALVLVVSCIAFSFTQLGFVNVELPGGQSGYAIILLLPVALGALLLGTLSGAALGLVAGSVLLVHAKTLPLDPYELTFVTPATSVFMLTVAGFMLGILFAFVLRNNPSKVKRAIYIATVCIIVSGLYSIGFAVHVFIQLILNIAETGEAEATTGYILQVTSSTLGRMGDPLIQASTTAGIMCVCCALGDYLAGRVSEHKDALAIRGVFGTWLLVVVVLAFMGMAAISFAVSTGDALQDAEDLMKSEVSYLKNQAKASDRRAELLRKIYDQGEIKYDKVDIAVFAEFADLFEDDVILEGYTTEADGVILICIGDSVYRSDDERFQGSGDLQDYFAPDAIKAIQRSKETGKMQRFVFDNPARLKAEADMAALAELNGGLAAEGIIERDSSASEIPDTQPCIAYVYVEGFDSTPATDGESVVDDERSIIMIQSSDQVFAKRESVMVWMSVSQLVLMLCVFACVVQLLSRVVVRRIDETNNALARITEGDLEARVEVHETREFESLSSGINTTVDAMKGWIAEAEARMDAELATAKAIQEAALPRIFPPYPDIQRFDIYAIMNAAKQVGGDFYDFFLVGDYTAEEGKLAFVVADVSGKGVPAALFMMKAKTQIRDYLESGMEVGEAIENANRQLCDGNEEGMFVTAWVGVLDYATRRVEYVNAGHNPPLLWKHAGGWDWLKQKSGMPLGLFEGLPYRAYTVECEVGDQFFLYSDGVTEAMSVNEELYGEDRLEKTLDEGYTLHPRKLVDTVRRDVANHARGAEQSDDITILALEVGVPPEITATLTVDAKPSELPRVNEFIHTELDRRLCPLRAQSQIDIAVEELFVNVCHYAYPEATPDNPGKVRVSYTYSAEPPSVRIDIADEGIPYNPLAKPDAVTPDDIMEVPIGGLGILMAKRSVNEMRYEREGSSNIVTVIKKW